MKALCEGAAEAAMPGRVLNVRAGLLVGPYDPIPRFAYWLRRISQESEVLAPGRPDRFIQLGADTLASQTIVRHELTQINTKKEKIICEICVNSWQK